MISLKGPVKYLIYLFIAAWMFLLGIMVGRGSSPVTFDTQKFQKRLESIANEFGDKKKSEKQIELKFYEVLDNPVAEEGSPSKEKMLEIIPEKEISKTQMDPKSDILPVKKSMKKQTLKPVESRENPTIKLKPETKIRKNRSSEQISVKTSDNKLDAESDTKPGKYTLQIAAYKEFKDAVTHMSALEKKGFITYRLRSEKDGVTWYRVRTGSFASYEEAELFKEKLDKVKIKSIIMPIQ